MINSRGSVLACVMSVGFTLYPPQPLEAQTPKEPPPVIVRSMPPDKGEIVGNTYKNIALGLEFTPDPNLKLGTPEVKGSPESGAQIVTVAALGEKKWFSANDETVFYADFTSYPESRRSTEAYMQRIVRTNESEGLQLVKSTGEEHFGGMLFSRSDFERSSMYEAVYAKTCDAFTLVFIFAGSDPQGVNKLIAQTRVKLDLKNPGCHDKSSTTPSKK